MSKCHFNAITNELRFTNTNHPTYVDKFWKVHQTVKTQNDHMTSILLVSLEICIDDSMLIWYSRWICPGWIFCPRNPHPFGNEWYTSCCEFYGLFFVVELVKGKVHTHQSGPLYFEDLGGKTVGLLLHMAKSYFTTGRHIILDSGFCVLKGLIKLSKKVFIIIIY